MNAFPKVLFITPHAFNKVTGGGITFSNLFSGWPKSAIATLHNDSEPPTNDTCDRYFNLTHAELRYVEPFASISRKQKKKSAVYEIHSNQCEGSARQDWRQKESLSGISRLVNLAKRAAIHFFGESFPERAHITPSLEKWISEFKPDVIYTILGSNGMMKLVEDVADHFELPIVVHFMDDWMEASHRSGLFGPFLHRQMLTRLTSIVDRASCCLVISPSMKEAYQKRFGRNFEAFQNTVDFQRWSSVAKQDICSGIVADIVYIGSIFPNAQLDALVQCCKAVAELNRTGTPAKLTISSPSGHGERYRSKLQVDSCIEIIDTIKDDDTFFRRIADADLLLLPVNFDEDSIRFIKYSMPTKVPAYLTAGGPVLVYGPAETAQVAYALSDGWGYVVDNPSLDRLIDGMRRSLLDSELRVKLILNARSNAQRNHDLKVVRAEFQKRIIDARKSDREVEA